MKMNYSYMQQHKWVLQVQGRAKEGRHSVGRYSSVCIQFKERNNETTVFRDTCLNSKTIQAKK